MTPVKGYTEMKGSGIPWIGEIPCHWDIRRNKTVFSCEKEIVGENSANIQLLSLTTNGIRKKSVDDTSGKVPESYDTYQYVHKDNLVLCLFDLDCSAVFSGLSKYEGMISPAYKVIKCNDNIVPGYADYWFRSVFDGRKFKYLAKNIRYSLTYEDFSALTLPHPPLSEQSAIAAYLDTQCAKIDEIIAQAKASIEDYKQWKASIIYEAVTKGLDPNVEMKDSVVEGIVEIPNHWRTLRIKYVSSLDAICDTSHISPDDVVTFAPMECIRNDIRIPKVATKSKDNGTYSSFIDGDIAIAKVTPCFENGNICIMDNLENGYAFGSSELFSLRPYGIDRRYFFYCLQTPTFIDGGAATMTGVGGLKRVSSYYMKNALIPIPPLEEQRTIAKFLGKKTALIATLISEKETLIDDLES